MHRFVPHVSWSSKWRFCQGLTLMELLVTLAILSILASAAMPYAEITVKRTREHELRRSLREIRTAIDHFHTDWKDGKISKLAGVASINGYPKDLAVLVQGVPVSGSSIKRKYLRRIPPDPMVRDKSKLLDVSWQRISYRDAPDTLTWGGEDIYDIRSTSTEQALDKSHYAKW